MLLFISYRKLSHIILSSFLIMMVVILYYSVSRVIERKIPTIFTMSSTIRAYKSISLDTNGNNKKDTINISIDESRKEYRIEVVNDDGKKFLLTPDSKDQTIGPYVPWWPLKITAADINMDNIPEIITQLSCTAHASPSHIFRWDGRKYTRVLSGSWDGISLLDVNGDRVPEIVTEERVPGTGEVYTVYSWIVNSYNKINISFDSLSRGYDKIKYIIRLINSPFEEKFPYEKYLRLYFTDDWLSDPKNIQSLNNFSRDVVGIQLQDYIGEEPKWDNKYISKSAIWKLRYVVFRRFGTEVKVENYEAEIETERTGDSNLSYKIKSMKFKGQ